MGYFKFTILFNICTISFKKNYLVMTYALVVPSLDNIFMVLLISALRNFKIDATKPIFLDSGFPREERGGSCVMGMVCYHCTVYILTLCKTLFSLSLTAICAELELCFQTT